MTPWPQHADDSCSVNQTVPAVGDSPVAPPVLVADHLPPISIPTSLLPHATALDDASVAEKGLSQVVADSLPSTEHRNSLQNPAPTSSLPTSESKQLSGDAQHESQELSPESADEQGGLSDDNDSFPEGGLGAWLVVFGSFCAMVSVYGLINSAAIFESYFSTNQLAGYDSSTIGWIFSLYLFLVFFAGIQVGPVFDRFGPRWLVLVGSLLCVASQMLLSISTTYYQILLTYSVLGGLGGALLNVPAYGVIAHFFKARRGLATGIAATSGSIGGIAFPFMFQALLPRLGFGWTVRISGFILLALSVPANLLVHSRLPPSTRKSSVLPDWSLFRDSKFVFCCLGLWFMEWGIFIPLTFIVSYAANHSGVGNISGGGGGGGGDAAGAAYTLLAFLNVGSFFGRFLPGFWADKVGRFNVIVVTNGLCAATILGLWLPVAWAGEAANALLIVFAVIFGFTSGSNLGLFPVCIGQLCDAREYGRVYSTALLVGSFGTLTSVPIGGALLSLGGGGDVGSGGSDHGTHASSSEQGWNALIVFSALSYVIAMSCFLGARVLAVSWRVKEVF